MWQQYFGTHPPGWEEDYRAGVLANTVSLSMGGKGVEITKMFPSLKTVFEQKSKLDKEKMVLPKGNFLYRMETAKGSDGSGWSLSDLVKKDSK